MKRDERKPEWIPDLVWSAYQRCKEYAAWAESNSAWIDSDDMLIPSRQDLEIFRKVLFDRQCKSIWQIVLTRTNDSTAIEVDESRSMPFQFLLWTLRMALSGPTSSSLIPAKERSDRGGKIAQLAKRLGRELEFISRKGHVPLDLSAPLAIHLESTYERYRDRDVDIDEIDVAMMEYDEGPQAISLIVRDLFFSGEESIFGVLAKSARTWANTKPDEYRSDLTRARRNYFVREMTRYFNVNFGQPHRASVASLVRCLLDLEMNALDVTRNAPVTRPASPAKSVRKEPIVPSTTRNPKKT